MMATKATDDQIAQFIRSNDGWMLVENKLQKQFVFSDFKQAFAFMTSIADYAEHNDHHPEWFNAYKTVKVDLITYDVSGISDRDFLMAKEMDSTANQLS